MSVHALNAKFDELKRLIAMVMPRDTAAGYLGLLGELAADRVENGVRFMGFLRAPAAKGNHHEVEGGLVLHLLEMWDCYLRLKVAFPIEIKGQIDDNLVLQAIVNHDLHKGYFTFVEDSVNKGKFQYAAATSNQMLSTDMQTIYLLMQAGIKPCMQVLNAHALAEGGWSKNPPKATSVLAKVCYLLDEMSGNVLERIRKGTIFDVRGDCFLAPAE